MVAPWDVWIPIGASALIAPSFFLLTVSIHHSSPAEGRIRTHRTMLLPTIYAALAELVYFTWLFIVEPRLVNGTQEEVGLLIFQPGSLLQKVDAAAYGSVILTRLALHISLSTSQRCPSSLEMGHLSMKHRACSEKLLVSFRQGRADL